MTYLLLFYSFSIQIWQEAEGQPIGIEEMSGEGVNKETMKEM